MNSQLGRVEVVSAADALSHAGTSATILKHNPSSLGVLTAVSLNSDEEQLVLKDFSLSRYFSSQTKGKERRITESSCLNKKWRFRDGVCSVEGINICLLDG
ncbi:hypothetical protein C2S51_020096 [Perilla frutescens var. frutescens]|nr:hypothetical protein C2S51_020096 [Perilla frutescens var. frutescens]